MTSKGIDEILEKLSAKFNRIFYDREFVGCVCLDLQILIKNKNKCCVLVFPTLSPNYLRVVRYQAKLFDLAVISLGSGSTKSVGVFHKKYFLQTSRETEDNSKKEILYVKKMAENSLTNSRKKRPAIQLYIPPAQRKCRLSEKSDNQKVPIINESFEKTVVKTEKETRKLHLAHILKEEVKTETEPFEIPCFCLEDVDCFISDITFNQECKFSKCSHLKELFLFAKLLIFSIKKKKCNFHWITWHQKTRNILIQESYQYCLKKYSVFHIQRQLFRGISEKLSNGIFLPSILELSEYRNLSAECAFLTRFCMCGQQPFVNVLKRYSSYLCIPQYENCSFDSFTFQDFLHCYLHDKDEILNLDTFYKTYMNPTMPISKCQLDYLLVNTENRTESPDMPISEDKNNCDMITEKCIKSENTNEVMKEVKTEPIELKNVPRNIGKVIALDERIETSNTNTLKSLPIIEEKNNRKDNEHEQEKEIMRKTKQNINRKTRPIIKYIDDDNDTLKIGKGDNVNNWEDLFSDDGDLQEDIFTEIIQKVGTEVTIVKATEDYSSYASKHIEELEHLVELYDFPSTFETHDIISAFSALNSDSMYIKWIDDTHALLVLGSYMQAQKAVELSSPLIKVRPMFAASRMALEKANQSDLKPAMKRPQTNLQTARRLITSHLGAKSRVSKEQSAKEREDLRVAKEVKKQTKQNEKDAWEGKLRSTVK